MDNSKDKLILVDIFDRPVGELDKLSVHRDGLLHRAFSVFLVDVPGRRLLLQKRAAGKYHSSGLWANTCCSHPRPEEEVLSAARRRLHEETGIRCELTELFTFIYRNVFDNGLSEYELDHVLVGNYDGESKDWLPDPDEIEELSWVGMEHLIVALSQRPQKFASWFLIAAPQVIAYMRRLIEKEKEKPVKVER